MVTSCGSQTITGFFFADGDFTQVDTTNIDTYGVRFE